MAMSNSDWAAGSMRSALESHSMRRGVVARPHVEISEDEQIVSSPRVRRDDLPEDAVGFIPAPARLYVWARPESPSSDEGVRCRPF